MATPAAPVMFDASCAAPVLAYDFTSFRRRDGQGNCSGAGTIAEPSSEQLGAWWEAVRAIRHPFGQMLDNTTQGADKADLRVAAVVRAIAALEEGVPGPRQIGPAVQELPYRVLFAFFRVLADALADPKE